VIVVIVVISMCFCVLLRASACFYMHGIHRGGRKSE
jgi:hypothetical protein